MPNKRSFSPQAANPGMVLVVSYIVLFGVNALVVFLANLMFPQYVVLGTRSISLTWAILHSAGTLALINMLAIPIAREIERWKGRMLTTTEWMIKYFVLNVAAVWAITRFSGQFGLGVSAWYVILVLGAVLDFAQGLAMMEMERVRTRK